MAKRLFEAGGWAISQLGDGRVFAALGRAIEALKSRSERNEKAPF